jgi:hypothetical protein
VDGGGFRVLLQLGKDEEEVIHPRIGEEGTRESSSPSMTVVVVLQRVSPKSDELQRWRPDKWYQRDVGEGARCFILEENEDELEFSTRGRKAARGGGGDLNRAETRHHGKGRERVVHRARGLWRAVTSGTAGEIAVLWQLHS